MTEPACENRTSDNIPISCSSWQRHKLSPIAGRATTASLVRRFPGAAQLFLRLGAREVKGRKGQRGRLPSEAARERRGRPGGKLAARGDGGGSNVWRHGSGGSRCEGRRGGSRQGKCLWR